MTKAKKEVKVNLQSFEINQVDNGWQVDARSISHWYDSSARDTTHVFTDLDDLLVWIEANI